MRRDIRLKLAPVKQGREVVLSFKDALGWFGYRYFAIYHKVGGIVFLKKQVEKTFVFHKYKMFK